MTKNYARQLTDEPFDENRLNQYLEGYQLITGSAFNQECGCNKASSVYNALFKANSDEQKDKGKK